MKVSIQSLEKRTFIGPSTTLAAVTASLLSLAGACGNTTSGSNGTGTAPFVAAPAAGTVAAAAGRPSTPAVAGTVAVATTAGASAPVGVPAAGSGTTIGPVATAGTAAPTAAGTAAPSGGAATFAAVLEILADRKNNCGTCHKVAMAGGGLVFDPADKAATWAALVGPASKGIDGSSCAGKVYVVPGNPDGSLLYDKVSKVKPSCGLRMPASGVILDDPEIATIKAWIMAGAPKD